MWICILWVLWHVPVLKSFAVQLSCDLELHGLVGRKLGVDVCVICALYQNPLLYSPYMQPKLSALNVFREHNTF
jgi:hypothetical protein